MTWEAVLRDRLDDPIDFTVADGNGIEKGTLLAMTDPRTAIAVSASGSAVAGIAAREKIASDGRVKLAVYRKGIFDMYASGAFSVGDPLAAAGFQNQVKLALSTVSGAGIIGHALETATDQEVVQVYLDVGGGSV